MLVRGLPNFTTTYNGREIFTAETRIVALQDFPSSNIAALEVFKTSSAGPRRAWPGRTGKRSVASAVRLFRQPGCWLGMGALSHASGRGWRAELQPARNDPFQGRRWQKWGRSAQRVADGNDLPRRGNLQHRFPSDI